MTLLNIIFFCVVLPLWITSGTVNLWAFYKRNRSVHDSKAWDKYHLIHSVSQVLTILIGITLGYLGAEVAHQW